LAITITTGKYKKLLGFLMGKTTKCKNEYTIEETIERFSKLKVVLDIIENKQLTKFNKEMLSNFFVEFPYSKCYDQICKNLAYFIKYDLDNFYERLTKLRNIKKNSLEWHLEQMGPAGQEIFNKKYIHNDNIKNKPTGYRTSKSAIEFFKEIDNLLFELGINAKPIYSNPEIKLNEYRIRDKNNKWFCYDYTVKELNIIVEYHGEHCHPNKEISVESWEKWRHLYTKESADTAYEKDLYKQKLAEEKGYRYFIIWYSENKQLSLERLKQIFLGIECKPYIPKTKRMYILTKPDGSEIKAINTKQFREEYHISKDKAWDLVHERAESYKGYKLRKIYELI
jgi:hypothetical protein